MAATKKAHTDTQKKAPDESATTSADPAPEQQPIIEWARQLLEDWQRRWVATGEIAKAELTLSVRCLMFALVFITAIALLMVFAWLTVLALGVWLLYNAGVAMWILLTGVLALHLLLALWLWLGTRRLLSEVGFKRSLAAVWPDSSSGGEEPAT